MKPLHLPLSLAASLRLDLPQPLSGRQMAMFPARQGLKASPLRDSFLLRLPRLSLLALLAPCRLVHTLNPRLIVLIRPVLRPRLLLPAPIRFVPIWLSVRCLVSVSRRLCKRIIRESGGCLSMTPTDDSRLFRRSMRRLWKNDSTYTLILSSCRP